MNPYNRICSFTLIRPIKISRPPTLLGVFPLLVLFNFLFSYISKQAGSELGYFLIDASEVP
jgi:hypothetical protein